MSGRKWISDGEGARMLKAAAGPPPPPPPEEEPPPEEPPPEEEPKGGPKLPPANHAVTWGQTQHGLSAGGYWSEGLKLTYPEVVPTLPSGSALRVRVTGFGGYGLGAGVQVLFGDTPGETASDAAGYPFLPTSGAALAKPSGGAMTSLRAVLTSPGRTLFWKQDGSWHACGTDYDLPVGIGRIFPEASEPRYQELGFYETGVPMRLLVLEQAFVTLGTTPVGMQLEAQTATWIKCANGMVIAYGGGPDGQLGNGFQGAEYPIVNNPASKPKQKVGESEAEYNAVVAAWKAQATKEKEEMYDKNEWRKAGKFPKLVQTGPPVNNPIVGVNVLDHVTMLAGGYGVSAYVREPSTGVQELLYAGVQSQYVQHVYAQVDPRFAKLQAMVPGLGTPGGPQITAIAAGANVILVLVSDGTVWALGSGIHGLQADGVVHTPEESKGEYVNQVPLPGPAKAIAAAYFHAAVLLVDGRVKSWGWNANGEVGNGENLFRQPVGGVDISTPAFVIDGVDAGGGKPRSPTFGEPLGSGAVKVVAISCGGELISGGAIGGDGTMALMSDGTIRNWGFGSTGIMANLQQEDSSVALEPGRMKLPEGYEADLTVRNVVGIALASNRAIALRQASLPMTGLPLVCAPGPESGSIKVDWTAPDFLTGKWAETAWLLEYRAFGTKTWTQANLGVALRTYVIKGLIPGQGYEVQLSGRNPPVEQYVAGAHTVLGAQEVQFPITVQAGQRLEPAIQFFYQVQDQILELPTVAQAEAQFKAKEPAHLVGSLDKWRQSRQIPVALSAGSNNITFFVPAVTEEPQFTYKEATTSAAFLKELEELPGVLKTGPHAPAYAGGAGKRTLRIRQVATLVSSNILVSKSTGGVKPNLVEGTWSPPYGTRYVPYTVAAS